jgi:nitronate monooxygenase
MKILGYCRLYVDMARLDTDLCQTVGLTHPIVQAPIGGGASPELIATVGDAGGLGLLPITPRGPDEIRETVREIDGRTDRPFGVNVVLEKQPDPESTEEKVASALEAGADVCSFSFGMAERHVEQVHDAGSTVMQTVGSAEEAAKAEEIGADVVVAQGWEAGGHVESEVATLPLVPRVVDAVDDIPVVAAGGIADGRGIAAVLALGGDGVWLGTRFVASKEATVHTKYQQNVLDASEADTEHTELFDIGWPDSPHRVVRNSTFEEWDAAERPPSGERPNEGEVIGEFPDGDPAQRYSYRSPPAGTEGKVESMALYAGQSSGLTNERPSAATVIDRLVSETIDAIDDLPSVVVDE